MPGVSQNTGSSSSGGGGNNSSSSDSSEKEVKKCIVRFFPCDGWKGEYGFDWFRTEDDPIREEVDEEGTKASAYYDCIGKYTGGKVRDLVLTYAKEGEIVERKSETRDSDALVFSEVSNDVHFATYYLDNYKLRIPVVKEGEKYYYFYYVPEKGDEKEVQFRYNHYDKKKELYYDSFFEIEYKGKSLKKLTLKTTKEVENSKGESYMVDYIATFGPGDKLKAKSKEIQKRYHADSKLIDRIYNCEMMFEQSLTAHPNITYVKVTPHSYKKLEVHLKHGEKTVTQTFEFENRKLYSFLQRTDDEAEHSVDIVAGMGYDRAKKKAEKEGVDEGLLDPDTTLGYLPDIDGVVSGMITIHNAEGQKGDLNVTKEMVDGEEVLTATVEGGGDEQYVLHPYWKDYYNGRGFTYKLESDSQHLRHYYFYPTLNLSYFKGMGDYSEFKKEAKIQVVIDGEYDEITLEPTNDNIEVSPKTLKGNGTVTVKVKGDTYQDGQKYTWSEPEINALSEGVMVGKLKMMVFNDFPAEALNNCLDIVNVGLKASTYSSEEDGVHMNHDLKCPTEASLKTQRRYNLDNEQFKQLLAQAGVRFKEVTTDKNIALEYEIVMEAEEGGVSSYDISATEMDMVTGVVVPEVPYHYLDFVHSARMFERYNIPNEKFENARTFFSDAVETQQRPTLKEYIDRRVVSVFYTLVDHLRVYLVDQFLTNDKEGKDHRYYDEYTDHQQESALVFIKSVDANNHAKSNVVAHSIFKAIKLKDLFNNYNDFTFKTGTTTNIMDSSQIRYSMMPFQWVDFHLAVLNDFKYEIPVMRRDHTLAMIEEHTTPTDEEGDTNFSL